MTDDTTPPGEQGQPDPGTADEQMRAKLLAQLKAAGLSLADLDILTGPAAVDTTLRALLPEQMVLLRRDMPGSANTWGPYLQMLRDGLPEVCPCPCPTCAVGPWPGRLGPAARPTPASRRRT